MGVKVKGFARGAPCIYTVLSARDRADIRGALPHPLGALTRPRSSAQRRAEGWKGGTG